MEAQYESLVLATEDMRQALEGASYLVKHGDGMDAGVVHVLLTGVITAYGRPYSDNKGVRKLGKRLAPIDPADKDLHAELLRLRNKLLAHTDSDGGRRVMPRTELRWKGGVGMVGHWSIHLPRDLAAPIADLAGKQQNHFLTRAIEIHKELDPTAGQSLEAPEELGG